MYRNMTNDSVEPRQTEKRNHLHNSEGYGTAVAMSDVVILLGIEQLLLFQFTQHD